MEMDKNRGDKPVDRINNRRMPSHRTRPHAARPERVEPEEAEVILEEPAAEFTPEEPAANLFFAEPAAEITEEPATEIVSEEPAESVPEDTDSVFAAEEPAAEAVFEEPIAEETVSEEPAADFAFVEPVTEFVPEEPITEFIPDEPDEAAPEEPISDALETESLQEAPSADLFLAEPKAEAADLFSKSTTEPGTVPAASPEGVPRAAYLPVAKKKKDIRTTARRMFGITGCLFLVIVFLFIVVLNGTTKKRRVDESKFMEQIQSQEVKENDNPAVDEFFNRYYTALSSGNTTDLEAMYDDPSKAHISAEVASIVEKYDIEKIYVTQGIEETELVVFVENEIHFANIEETAPSVDSFYLVYEKESDSYKICADMYTDQAILKFMNLVSYREPIRSLLEDTDKELKKVLSGDKDLNNLYILMQSMADKAWDQSTEEEAAK